MDDSVKVWELTDGALKLKHKLTGYSLGVVSIAISSDGTSKQIKILIQYVLIDLDLSVIFHL